MSRAGEVALNVLAIAVGIALILLSLLPLLPSRLRRALAPARPVLVHPGTNREMPPAPDVMEAWQMDGHVAEPSEELAEVP